MQEIPIVTVFLRNGSDVLFLRRSEEVGAYSGRWGGVSGYAEDDPDAAAREEIREETGIDSEHQTDLRRRGEAFPVVDSDLDTRWIVHPYLFDCDTRSVDPNNETSEFEWTVPTAILRRDTVPKFWTSYDRIRPRISTIENDTTHGSADLSIRALDVLRDEAALAVERRAEREWVDLCETARAFVEARPAMPVLTTRVNRVMSDAESAHMAEAVESAANEEIFRALSADDEAAVEAVNHIGHLRVATLSRSGTLTSSPP